jgi:hypothetical protein
MFAVFEEDIESRVLPATGFKIVTIIFAVGFVE